ncbi:MAG: Ig-like domain-containing protein [Acidobacteria bacterium]|nr:Ig-like domain-containing protein [Acidobacteriota bacterium]
MSRLQRGALLGLPLLVLLGCGGSTDVKSVPPPNAGDAPTTSGTYPVFDASAGAIPLPNILATATAKDPLTGTFLTSDPVVRPANTPLTPPEALAYVHHRETGAVNAVSGLNAPIYIRFSNPVDPASLAGNVKVFQLTADAATGGQTENNALGFTDITAMFTISYKAGTTDLHVFPNFPLTPGTKYGYFVKNGVKDAATGLPTITPLQMTAMKSPVPITGLLAGLEPIRADKVSGPNILLRGYKQFMDDAITATATTGITSLGEITLLGRFITTIAGFTLPDPVGAPTTRVPVESTLRQFAAGATLGGLSGKTWSNAATIPANTLPSGPFTTFVKGTPVSPDAYWTAVMGSATAAPASVGLVALGTFASGDLNIDPVVAKANAATMNLTGTAGAWNPGAGVTQAFRNAGGVLTGYYHTDRTLNFVYIAPDPATITRPANGYPMVIYQHGITSQKETVIALAGTLTAQGYALIAIDLPLHGQNQVPTHTAGAQWGQDFMAIGAPLATRTNLQQGVVNLSRLEFVVKTGGLSTALAGAGLATSTPDITTSPSNIKYVGVSLGAIVGSYYLASNTTFSYPAGPSGPPYIQATLNNDMKGFLNNPGGRTAYLIQNSPAFGPTVDAGLAAVGIVKNTPTYHSFFQVTQTIVDPADPATMTNPLAAGLPSRLSGRVAVQEATSTTFDPVTGAPTNGDLVITNPYTRFFGNSLGGRAILGGAGAAVGPNFSQLAYTAGGTYMAPTPGGLVATAHAAGVVGSPFMLTLSPGPAPKVINAATSVLDAAPKEGYFQFDQTGIGHAFILNPTNPVAIALGQRQLVYWLGFGLVVDPTQQGATLPIVQPASLPESMIFDAPKAITILAH